MGTLHEDLHTFMVSCWILLRMRNVSYKSCRENQNTYWMFNNFFPKILPFMRLCGKIWWHMATNDNVIWCMHFACWITKATNTHSEYVILLFHVNNDFANVSQCYSYMYIACPAKNNYISLMFLWRKQCNTYVALINLVYIIFHVQKILLKGDSL
jgi:hypothetical protein